MFSKFHMERDVHIQILDETFREEVLHYLFELNEKSPKDIIVNRYEAALEQSNYRIYGIFKSGEVQGIAGIHKGVMVWCGRYFYIDNVIIDKSLRGLGIGETLFEYIDDLAREEGIELIMLDVYTANKKAQKFYHKVGYRIEGFHFVKDV